MQSTQELIIPNDPLRLVDEMHGADNAAARMRAFGRVVATGALQTLEPLLPLCFTLDGKPYDLAEHAPFAPMFRTNRPRQIVFRTGRQVAKSTSMAADGVLLSNCLPFFRTLYVMPLYEQVRRFSNNYVRPFIDTSPLRPLWVPTGTDRSVLQRSFANQSKMLFSFALLDADRVRGISCDKLCIDESYCTSTTYVDVPTGKKLLAEVQPGELVKSFDYSGNMVWKPVVSCRYHGRRRCYRLITRDGKHVDATADTYMATDAGWLRISEIVATIAGRSRDAGANSDGGNAPGINGSGMDTVSRQSVRGRTHLTDELLGVSPRMATTRVPLDEIHRTVRFRTWRAVEIEEERTRLRVGTVLDCANANIQLLTGSDVSIGYQDCHAEVVGSDRSVRIFSDDGLVACRRRNAVGAVTFPKPSDLHERLQLPRGRTLMRLADGTRLPVLSFDASRSGSSPVSNGIIRRSLGGQVDAGVTGLDAAMYALQAGDYRSAGSVCLPLLRATIHGQNGNEVANAGPLAVLPSRSMSTVAETAVLQTRTNAGGDSEDKSAAKNTVRYGHGVSPKTQYREHGVVKGETRETETVQGRISRKGEGKTAIVAVRGLRRNDRRNYKNRHTLLSDVPQTTIVTTGREAGTGNKVKKIEHSCTAAREVASEGTRAGTLTGSNLRYIIDIGLQDVADIEVEDTHTFLANGIACTNCQDIDPAHIPIVRESLSHSDYGLMQFTGTPKTLDNGLEGLWLKSSQAEWFIPCLHCHEWNIPSREQHIDGMIGPLHPHISEAYPGTVCYFCQKPINPRFGHWVHKFRERRQSFAGYHIPQIILPLHFARYDKWAELLYKRGGGNNTSTATFWNEVLGEGVDTGQKLVTETELKQASTLPWPNIPSKPDPRMRALIQDYTMRVLAVDWGGGGESGVSFTVAALLGMTPTGQIHCLWGKRFVLSQEHLREARELLHWLQVFRCNLFAHDYTGAGVVRETVLVQAGFEPSRVMPIQLGRSAAVSLIRYVPPSLLHNRGHFSLDKTRSLLYTCQAIKTGLLRFFAYDRQDSDDPGLIGDFLALVEEKTETRLAGDIYTITRNTMLTDDFAQAVNLGCAALWHANGAWPNFAEAAGIARVSAGQILAATGPDPEWNDREVMGGFFNQP